MKPARRLLRHNIDAILRERKQTRHDLAFFCRRSDAWVSKILSEKESDQARGIPLKYLDRIAEFFGIEVHQLFSPGIDVFTERRKTERRSGADRRQRRAFPQDVMPITDAELIAELRLLTQGDRATMLRLIGGVRRAQDAEPPTTDRRGPGKRV